MDAAPPDFDYSLADFLRDLDELEARGVFEGEPAERSLQRTLGVTTSYFKERYSVREEAVNKAMRFHAALMYLSDHIREFDVGSLSVYGSPSVGALVGEPLLAAIHQLIVEPLRRPFRDAPPPAEIIALATRLAEDTKSAERERQS